MYRLIAIAFAASVFTSTASAQYQPCANGQCQARPATGVLPTMTRFAESTMHWITGMPTNRTAADPPASYSYAGYPTANCPNGNCATPAYGTHQHVNGVCTTGQCVTGQCPNGQCSTGQCANGQCSTGQCPNGQCDTRFRPTNNGSDVVCGPNGCYLRNPAGSGVTTVPANGFTAPQDRLNDFGRPLGNGHYVGDGHNHRTRPNSMNDQYYPTATERNGNYDARLRPAQPFAAPYDTRYQLPKAGFPVQQDGAYY